MASAQLARASTIWNSSTMKSLRRQAGNCGGGLAQVVERALEKTVRRSTPTGRPRRRVRDRGEFVGFESIESNLLRRGFFQFGNHGESGSVLGYAAKLGAKSARAWALAARSRLAGRSRAGLRNALARSATMESREAGIGSFNYTEAARFGWAGDRANLGVWIDRR